MRTFLQLLLVQCVVQYVFTAANPLQWPTNTTIGDTEDPADPVGVWLGHVVGRIIAEDPLERPAALVGTNDPDDVAEWLRRAIAEFFVIAEWFFNHTLRFELVDGQPCLSGPAEKDFHGCRYKFRIWVCWRSWQLKWDANATLGRFTAFAQGYKADTGAQDHAIKMILESMNQIGEIDSCLCHSDPLAIGPSCKFETTCCAILDIERTDLPNFVFGYRCAATDTKTNTTALNKYPFPLDVNKARCEPVYKLLDNQDLDSCLCHHGTKQMKKTNVRYACCKYFTTVDQLAAETPFYRARVWDRNLTGFHQGPPHLSNENAAIEQAISNMYRDTATSGLVMKFVAGGFAALCLGLAFLCCVYRRFVGRKKICKCNTYAILPPSVLQGGDQCVFICHSGRNKRQAIRLWALLRLLGINAFLDRCNLQIGGRFPDEIAQALNSACVGVILLGADFFERKWCIMEAKTILERQKKDNILVCPIFLEKAACGAGCKVLEELNAISGAQVNELRDVYDDARPALFKAGFQLAVALHPQHGEALIQLELRVERALCAIDKEMLSPFRSSPSKPSLEAFLERARKRMERAAGGGRRDEECPYQRLGGGGLS